MFRLFLWFTKAGSGKYERIILSLFSRSPRVQDQQCIVQGATATESPRAFPFQIERIDLPSADRMRNAEFHDRHLPGIIEVRNEEASWLEKMGFESHGFLNLNRLRGHAHFLKLPHDGLLARWRELQFRLRTEVLSEKGGVVIDADALHEFPGKGARFPVHGFLVIEKPPRAGADEREQNNQDNQAGAGCVRSTISFHS